MSGRVDQPAAGIAAAHVGIVTDDGSREFSPGLQIETAYVTAQLDTMPTAANI